MLLVARCIVKQKKALGLILGETLKNVDGLINFCERRLAASKYPL